MQEHYSIRASCQNNHWTILHLYQKRRKSPPTHKSPVLGLHWYHGIDDVDSWSFVVCMRNIRFALTSRARRPWLILLMKLWKNDEAIFGSWRGAWLMSSLLVWREVCLFRSVMGFCLVVCSLVRWFLLQMGGYLSIWFTLGKTHKRKQKTYKRKRKT